MKVAERMLLALLLTLGLSGCRAFNNGSLSMTPRPLPRPASFDLDRFVAEHNRNAERIENLTAKPSIGVAGRVMRARADGLMALERPRNFKLELSSMGDKKADMGSNEDEFWFWVQNDKDRSIYWCRYSELSSNVLTITHQPDWIVESLGLRLITPDEAAQIKVKKGQEPGTTALIFPPAKSGGETYTRMMVVWDKTRRIKEHRIYAGNLQTLVAQAEVKGYKDFDLPSSSGESAETCYLPESVRLDWKRDQLALDVLLQDVKVNQFDTSRSALLFVEPEMPGYERVNLAELSRRQMKDQRTSVRHTLPAPDPKKSVRLGAPMPLSEQPASNSSGADGQTSDGRAAVVLDNLVTAPLPVSTETDAVRAASSAWAASSSSPIGR